MEINLENHFLKIIKKAHLSENTFRVGDVK